MNLSPLLALFGRSLRQDARAKSTYWARAGLVLMMLVMMFTTHLSMGWGGAPGLQFFSSAIYTNFVFISLAGLSYFASAITEEKEEMTLGLLRMTNLNPLSILLGKSTSRLFGALLLLATQFPFTLLAVSFGGVSISQIVAIYCSLAAFVIFLSNLALLFSVICARTAGAAILTGLSLLFFTIGPSLIAGMIELLKWWGWLGKSFTSLGLAHFLEGWSRMLPGQRFSEVLTTGFNDSPLCLQVFSNLALGLICFLLAWAVFDLFCSDQKDAAPRRGLLFKRTSKLRAIGAGRPWKRALIWKDFNFLNGGKLAVVSKLIVYPLVIWSLLAMNQMLRKPVSWANIGYFTMGVAAFVAQVEMAIIAGRVFRQERRWKTLSSLAMLPLSTRRIAYQKVLGCLCACWPAFFIFAVGLALSSGEMWRALHRWWAFSQKTGIANTMKSMIEWEVIGGFGFAFVLGIFFLHLVATLSLRFKWGALPMSIAITYAGSMFAIPLAFVMFKSAAFLGLIVMLIVATGVLHVALGARLEALAAED